MKVSNLLFLLLLASSVPPSLADEQRHHGAHEHGAGKLDIALDGAQLQIELDSPAVNLAGFEHAPKNDEERKILERALARLRDGAELFEMPKAADCRLVDADIDTPLVKHGEGAAHPAEPQHAEHEHHSEHEHEDGHEYEESHADINATWSFTCAHPEALNSVSVQLFKAFPMTQRLQVQFITANRQGGAELSPSNPVLSF